MTLNRYSVCAAILLISFPHLTFGKEARPLKWSELDGAIAGRKVSLTLASKATLQGTVTSVQNDSLQMDVVGSSDKQAYGLGQASIPRNQVVQVKVKRVKGPARLIGAAGIGTAVALGSLGWAISEDRVNVSDSARIAGWAAITGAAVVGGYFIGRAIDTKEEVFLIQPD